MRVLKLKESAKGIMMNSKFPNRDLWALSIMEQYDRDKPGCTVLHKLEEADDLQLYQTSDNIITGPFGNADFFGRLPVYHVWYKDKRIYCGQSMSAAYAKYNQCKNRMTERRKDNENDCEDN